MKKFLVTFLPLPGSSEPDTLLIEAYDLGFNQLGWIILSDEMRNPIAILSPTTVKSISIWNSEIIDVSPETPKVLVQ